MSFEEQFLGLEGKSYHLELETNVQGEKMPTEVIGIFSEEDNKIWICTDKRLFYLQNDIKKHCLDKQKCLDIINDLPEIDEDGGKMLACNKLFLLEKLGLD